ncbi:DNA polymerase III [Sulfurifustis variabilis]|uniref:DNA polymerase beta n=1 Tax=Sulfurifustis variabilis TaxID=1675686 RepID=A0A1B4V7R2_9GAMM|nr:DNA polymerase/3'-5' exonuclease PolX [Sulfurifustis variabilis]BAU49525.1 DNA polymerase III [Sulfurifustis variabilis]
MAVHNADIAKVFEEIADLLEIQGENPFRIRAYRNASRLIEGLGVSIGEMIEKNEDLTELPGIGKDLAGKINEVVATGTCEALEKLRKQLPPTLTTLLRIPGLGPKRVQTLYRELDIGTPEQLYAAAHEGKISALPHFGEKIETTILQAMEKHVEKEARFKLATAAQYAEPLKSYLETIPGVNRVVIAGSYRRAKETVGDIDVLVTARRGSPVMDRFTEYDEVEQILSKGPTRSTVKLRCGLQVDLRFVPQASFGAALHYFTGSKAHNIAIRRLGQQKRLKINEYGVFRGTKRITGETEESVFRSVDLPFIPPEMRENRGEIEAARAGKLPRLVEIGDIRGDLHVHTNATDGHNTLKEMVEAAKMRGYEYVAITEHSRRVTVAKGLDPQRLRKQIDEIDRLNEKRLGITVLKGIEVDILEDGKLDLPDSVLSELDLVVCAVHSKFDLPKGRQTERVLRAMDNRYFTILAHPTGRLIQERGPLELDMLKVIRKARERGCFLELNAHPERLDLLDVYCQMARDEGVAVAVSTDAHSTRDYDYMKYGIGQARRGWLEAKDVLNTKGLADLERLLKAARGA